MSKKKRAVGAPKGSRNAAKDNPKTGKVELRCHLTDKTRWVKRAQKEGKSLAQWITDRCNAH